MTVMTPEAIRDVLIKHRAWLTGETSGSRADLSGANLRDAVLSGAVLRDADLRGADLRGADLRGADLRDADLSGAVLRGADLSDANLSGAVLRRAVLGRADLSRAVLRGADLSDANLNGANLRDADLSGAVLRGADLSDANLSGAVLRGADLSDANLSGANGLPTEIPVVPDLDKQIHAAVCGPQAPGVLDMSNWHGQGGVCGTTHCRAGWAIHIAGERGAALEKTVGPCAAGALIYHASTGRVPNFYADNETALREICELAK